MINFQVGTGKDGNHDCQNGESSCGEDYLDFAWQRAEVLPLTGVNEVPDRDQKDESNPQHRRALKRKLRLVEVLHHLVSYTD